MIRRLLICVSLVLLNAIVFRGLRYCEFINYDDGRLVTDVPRLQQGFTVDNVKWALTTQELEFWHPLVWLSHMLDFKLFGLDPAGHHLMNLGYHTAGTIALFFAFDSLTKQTWRSAILAALFAIHP